MQHVLKRSPKAQSAGTQLQLATYCSAFKTSPSPQSSWVAPVVAPVQPASVAKPSEYRFASRAPVVRRSPSAKKPPKPNTAYHGQPSVSSTIGKPSASSYAHQNCALEQRYYDPGNQYDEFLATFQHRIDGMTGQRGGWGF